MTLLVQAQFPKLQLQKQLDELETSSRSVSSKLRKMGYEVELASASQSKSFSEEQESTLANFVNDNSGQYTYAEIAENFEGGAFCQVNSR